MNISSLLDEDFKVIVTKMFTKLGRRMVEYNENFNKDIKKCKKEPIRAEEYNN